MNAANYLAKNKDNIRHYNEVKQVIDELKDHRTDFGKICLYCIENLINDKNIEDKQYLENQKDKYSYEPRQNGNIVENEIKFNAGFDWKKCAEIRQELIKVTEKDETYIVLYRFLLSEYAHLHESYSCTVEEYNKFARQAERAIKFDRDEPMEKLKTIENHNEKLTYLINRKTDYLNESHKWKDLPEYNFLELCENEINRLQELQKINDLPKTSVIAIETNFKLSDNLLSKLQEQKFIENAMARPLKWLKSKSLLAYFVEVANDELNLKNGEKRRIKPFETLFKMSGLTSAINDYKKTGTLPVGYKDIDKLFS